MARCALAAIVLALGAAHGAQGGETDDVGLTVKAPRLIEVAPGAERVASELRVRCDSACDVRATGKVTVTLRGGRTFALRLSPAGAELGAGGARALRPRLSTRATRRLQNALDRPGTFAGADVSVRASGEGGETADVDAETELAPGFGLTARSAGPRLTYFGAKREPTLGFRFRAPAPLDLRVVVRKSGRARAVRTFRLRNAKPFAKHKVRWNWLDNRGRYAGNGSYSFSIEAPGVRTSRTRGLAVRGHVFPVAGPHGIRGDGLSDFGDPRSGGRTHEGFDVTADCGTRLVAARGGEVVRRSFDPRLYGWFVEIREKDSGRHLFYAHMRVPPPVSKGDRVRTGQTVGEVGQTGNAASTPCHLHFEIRDGGRPIDPAPELRRWDRWS